MLVWLPRLPSYPTHITTTTHGYPPTHPPTQRVKMYMLVFTIRINQILSLHTPTHIHIHIRIYVSPHYPPLHTHTRMHICLRRGRRGTGRLYGICRRAAGLAACVGRSARRNRHVAAVCSGLGHASARGREGRGSGAGRWRPAREGRSSSVLPCFRRKSGGGKGEYNGCSSNKGWCGERREAEKKTGRMVKHMREQGPDEVKDRDSR